MLQIYFLSIAANILAGLASSSEYLAGRFPGFAPLRDLFRTGSYRAVLGVCTALVGLLKLLLPFGVPVVGDLIPALVGLALGASLVLQVLREKADLPHESLGKLQKAALAYRLPLGIAGIAAGVLHFLLPQALFL
jgi:hypothetical protein